MIFDYYNFVSCQGDFVSHEQACYFYVQRIFHVYGVSGFSDFFWLSGVSCMSSSYGISVSFGMFDVYSFYYLSVVFGIYDMTVL